MSEVTSIQMFKRDICALERQDGDYANTWVVSYCGWKWARTEIQRRRWGWGKHNIWNECRM